MPASHVRPRWPHAPIALLIAVAMSLVSTPAAHAAADTTAPTTPGAPSFTQVTPYAVTLSWAPSTDDVGVGNYLVRRALPTGGFWTDSTAGTTTITIQDLTPNNLYTFSIVATDAAGNTSAASPPAQVRTLRYTAGTMCSVAYRPIGSGSGSFQSQVDMTNLTPGVWQEWTLAFTLAPGQQVRPEWGFQQNGTRWSQTFVWLWSSGSGPLQPGGTRSVTFTGSYTGGNPPPTEFAINDHPCTVTGVPTAPGQPGNLTASNVTAGGAALAWTAAIPGTNPISGYEVLVDGYRYTCVGVNPLGCLVSGLAPAGSHAYSVRAVDTTGLVGPAATIVVQTPAPPPGTCAVAYRISDWGNGSGFTASLTITNTSTSVLSGWTLRFSFAAGQRVVQGWNADWRQPPGSPDVTATSLTWNAAIPVGASLTIGFNGSHSGANPRPAAFTLNGAVCSVS